jgi:hypothetical protein
MKRMTRIRTLQLAAGLALSCLFTSALAGLNTWTPIGPDGGQVLGLEFHPSRAGVAYAIVEKGFYRSADNGASWTLQPRRFVQTLTALAVDPTDGDTLFVSELDNGLWRSTDQGATFEFLGPVNGDGNVARLEIASDGNRMVASSGTLRLFVSDNGGATWADRTPTGSPPVVPSFFCALAIDPTNPNILYAGMRQGGVFRSTNGGASWTQLLGGTSGTHDYEIVIDPANPAHLLLMSVQILESFDSGASWSIMFGAAGPVAAFDPQDSQRLYVGSIHNAVFYTEDGGTMWSLVNTDNGVACGWFNRIIVDPRDSNRILGAGDEGICRSTSAGASWTPASTGIKATRVTALRTAPGPQRQILVGLSPGPAYVASDPNGTWQRLDSQIFRLGGAPSGIPVVEFAGGDPASNWFVASRTGGLLRTRNAGGTWAVGDFVGAFSDVARHPVAADTFYAATDSGVHKTIDGGAHWTAGNIPAGFRDFLSVAVDPSDPDVIYAGANWRNGAALGVAKSVDGGQEWTPANVGIETQAINRIAVNPADSNVIYAAGAGLFKSVDAGRNWSLLPSMVATLEDIALDPVKPQILYAVSTTLSRSVDGGATWQELRALEGDFVQRVALDTLDPTIIYAGRLRGGLETLQIAPDLALTANAPTTSAAAGTAIPITYQLQNRGTFTASSVVLTADFPPALVTEVPTMQPDRGSCTFASGRVRCSIGAVVAGEVISVLIQFRAAAGTVDALASLTAYESDPLASNNNTQSSMTVTAGTSAPPPPAPPSGGGGNGGGGGGGSATTELLLLLGTMQLARRCRRRYSIASSNAAMRLRS